MTFKHTIHNFFQKQIRIRLARFYECDDCEKRYRLTYKRIECPNCHTEPICMWDDPVSGFPDTCCEGSIENNGKCVDCGYQNKLYFQPIAFSVLYKHTKWFIRDHFDINRHDQWIGHYYKIDRGNYHDTGKPFTMITHYICVIPCLVFEFTRYRDGR